MIWKFPEKKWHIGLHCLVKSQHLRIFQAAIVGTPTESSKVVTFCNLVVLTLLLDGRSNWWLVRFLRKKRLVWVGSSRMKGGCICLLFVCLFTRSSRRHRFYHNKDWEDSCPFDLSSVCFVCFFGQGVELKCFHQTKSSWPQKHAQQKSNGETSLKLR